MGKSQLNGLTTNERMIYAHARTSRDMQDLRQQIYAMHRIALFERTLLLVLYIIFPMILLSTFFFLNPTNTLEYILLTIIAVMFVIACFVSNNISQRQIWMVDGLQFFYSKLAEDESVKFAAEAMQVEKVESDDLAIAWHMIDELIARIQKGNHKKDDDGAGNSRPTESRGTGTL